MGENADFLVRRVPRDESGRMELLTLRPLLWEYLLFENVLYVSRAKHEIRWRDFQLNLTLRVGPIVEAKDLPHVLSERFSYISSIVGKVGNIFDSTVQERAFGKPGEHGDAGLIEHMASRLIDLYVLLLNWAEETRALRLPEEAERLQELLIAYIRQPLHQIYNFVDSSISKLEEAIDNLASGKTEYENIDLHLTFEIDDALSRDFNEELRHVGEILVLHDE